MTASGWREIWKQAGAFLPINVGGTWHEAIDELASIKWRDGEKCWAGRRRLKEKAGRNRRLAWHAWGNRGDGASPR